MALKHYGAAQLDYNAAILINPQYCDAYTERGVLFENFYFDPKRSSKDYYKAISLTSISDTKALSILYSDVAGDEFNMGNIDSALNLATIAIHFNPTNAIAYISRAGIYMSLTAYTRAIDDLNLAINYYSGSDKKELSKWYCNRADTKTMNKQLKDAINDYSFAVKLDSNNCKAYWNRANAYYQHGDYQLAIKDYAVAINFQTFDKDYNSIYLSNLYDSKAKCEIGANLLDDAIKDELDAINVHKEIGKNYVDLGMAYTLKGDFEKAIHQSLISEQHISNTMATSYIYTLVANNQYMLKKYKKALAYCDTATFWNANDEDAYYYRAKVYLKMNNKEKAMSDFNTYIQLNNEKHTINYFFSLYYTGKGEDAINLLKQTILNTTDDVQVMRYYYNLACLYSLMNNVDEANKYLKLSIDKGYSKKYASVDMDLDNIRNTSDYKITVSSHR